MDKFIISIDGHCDVPQQLQATYGIVAVPFEVVLDGELFTDTEQGKPLSKMPEVWRSKGCYPQTAAISPAKYIEVFEKYIAQGYKVLHITIASGGSACYNNCMLAAQALPEQSVYVFDSQSISFGLVILAIKAKEMLGKGHSIDFTLNKLTQLRPTVQGGYLLDTVTFLTKGGRIPNMDIGANAKYEFVTNNNAMVVNSVYNDTMDRVIEPFIKLKFSTDNINKQRIFVDVSLLSESNVAKIVRLLHEIGFENIYTQQAKWSCAGHMGPNSFGLYYLTKE